jgi:hypothetical protein
VASRVRKWAARLQSEMNFSAPSPAFAWKSRAIEVDEIPVFSADAVEAVWKRSDNKNNSMKKITLLTLAVAMLAGLTLTAADDAAPKKNKPTAEEIKKYDKNGDGKLDKEERAALNADKKKAKEAK